ncbi:MAG: aldehyde dehydrogenase [Sphaerochaetaceae bacterium]
MDIQTVVRSQRTFFQSGATLSLSFRLDALKRLQKALIEHTHELTEALYRDLHKSEHEAYMSEVGLALEEIRYHIRHLRKWAKPDKVSPSIGQFPAKVRVLKEPFGVTLIMSPWNYPVLLTLSPLIGALSAGNCAVVKPSAYSESTSAVLEKLLSSLFPSEYVYVVQGGRDANTALLNQRFDYIFFTGSTAVGKVVMRAASENLTPVTLELGGKSPVIVTRNCNLDIAAKRIIFGKLINAGQTCIAPDYLLVEKEVREPLIEKMKHYIVQFVGENANACEQYPGIINRKRYDRLIELLEQTTVIYGGRCEYPFIEPALAVPNDRDLLLEEEIFGPILPIIEIGSIDEAVDIIRSKERPLALYLFTDDKMIEKRICETLSFGGGCVNDTILHLANVKAPFGGVGYSGMGMYHGKYSFDLLSHHKTVMKKGKLFDINARYHPYNEKKSALIRKVLK